MSEGETPGPVSEEQQDTSTMYIEKENVIFFFPYWY